MRVAQRVDYALRALALLASQPEGSYTPAGDLAERLGLPRRFVEQQVTDLTREGLLVSRRGAAGGCALARSADDITVTDVLYALDGAVVDVPRQPDCATAELWAHAAVRMSDFLAQTTIGDLARRQREIDGAKAEMYFI